MFFGPLFVPSQNISLHSYFVCWGIFLFSSTISIAQKINVDTHLYAIYEEDTMYSGEGIDWMLHKSDSTQFYLFGEQHGIKGIPELVSSVYTKLNINDSFHLALEMDEWTTSKILKEGTDRIASKYPHSIAFDYDGDIALIKSAEKHSEIWGLDQMVTAIHPYQRLIEIAPNEQARRLTRGAFLKASLKMGEYLPQSHFEDFIAIRKAFGKDISKEADLILNQLKASMEIYVAYRAGQRGEIPRQVTVKMREKFMMDQFDSYINKNPKQKVLFKMGGAHTVKGIGPNGVETLGNYVQNTANQHQLNALYIGLFNYNTALQFVDKEIFNRSDIVLFDCKTYLKTISDSLFSSFSNSNKSLLKGNDAIILYNDAKRAEKKIIRAHQNTFKSNLIQRISIGGLFIVLCFSIIFPVVLYSFSKRNRTRTYNTYGKLLIQLLIVSIGTILIICYQVYVIISVSAPSIIIDGTMSIWIYILLFLLVVYFMYKTGVFLRTDAKKKHKVYLVFTTISYLFLVSFMYYWNIGGMLSV